MNDCAGYINKSYIVSRYNNRRTKNKERKYSQLKSYPIIVKKEENRYFTQFRGTVSSYSSTRMWKSQNFLTAHAC